MNRAKKSNPLLWIIPLGCFGVVLVTCGGCLVLPLWLGVTAIKSNQAFAQSLDQVKSDPRVVAELGEPIEMGWSIQGNFNSSNGKESANITYPISGPSGTGSVEVQATGEGGQWTFHKLVVTANEKRIDLLGEEGIVLEPDRVQASAEEEAGATTEQAPDADAPSSDEPADNDSGTEAESEDAATGDTDAP